MKEGHSLIIELEKWDFLLQNEAHTLEGSDYNLVKYRVKNDEQIDLSTNFPSQTLLGLLPKSFKNTFRSKHFIGSSY